MIEDRPLLGIALMLGFCLVAPMGDAVAKLIGQSVALGPMLLIRFVAQVILLAPFILLSLRPWRMSARAYRLSFLRTLLHIAAIGLMFNALRYMPLADAIAIVFVLPLLMLLLGKLVLGEAVGPARLAACCVGFLGTLLVIQPSFAAVGWVALLPLGSALLFAFFMLITRTIAHETDPIGLQFVSGIMATVILLPALLLGGTLGASELTWAQPTALEWALMLSVGGLGTLAHLLMTWSLRYAPSATVTPMQYIEIPIAALIGLAVFAEWPNALACLGICITIAAGLFVMLYEQTSHRRARREALAQQVAVRTAAE